MIKSYFVGDNMVSNSSGAYSFYEKSRLGEKKNGRIEYSNIEALYLVFNGSMKLFAGKKMISADLLLQKLKRKDKKIETKLAVFSDLRRKGYIVKTALKFGAEFRVYGKGIKPGEGHAQWILHCAKESDNLKWHEFAAQNRVAHSTKKNLLVAIVDDEDDVSYYEARWMKP
ncbi:MAG: tRNA-intron lyase [Nanoarchaeota archaeon]